MAIDYDKLGLFKPKMNLKSLVQQQAQAIREDTEYVGDNSDKANLQGIYLSSIKEGCKSESCKDKEVCPKCLKIHCTCKKDSEDEEDEEDEESHNEFLDININSKNNNTSKERMYYNGYKKSKKNSKQKRVKKALVKEALKMMLNDSMGLSLMNTSNIQNNLVESFVESDIIENHLHNWSEKSYFLSEMVRLVEEYADIIVEDVSDDDNKELIVIDTNQKSSFLDDIKKLDYADITDAIRARVSSAIDTFVTSNAEMKSQLEDDIRSTQEKIDKADNEEIKESYEYKIKRYKNALMDNKPKNIYEAMIEKISYASVVNENMSMYKNYDGKLDMMKISESCKAMYTFLEMLNTAKLASVDEAYINDVLDNLK